MNRLRILAILALAVTACSGGSEKPGAMFRGPAALAVFQGRVAHDDGGLHPYLAVGNERGDELRLVHLDDNEVVESPGLAFPLSVPVDGRPMLVAAADMNEVTKPSALAVVEAGSYVPGLPVANVLDLIDTWNGFTTVATQVTLATDGEVLAIAPAAVPDGAGGKVADRARFVVALTGGRLEIVELTRVAASDEIVATRLAAPLGGLPFDVTSLSQGADPGFIYAGSMDGNPGFGVAKIALPADLTGWSASAPGTVEWFTTGAPTRSIAAVSYAGWDYSTGVSDPAEAVVERVVVVPVPGECGPGKLVRCGLLSLDSGTGMLAPAWIPLLKQVPSDEGHLLPIPVPAPVTALAAVGRAAAALMPVVSGAGTVNTSGLAVATATDGGIYFVDLAHWSMISETSPLVGAGKTRASAASVVAGTASAIGLQALGGTAYSAKSTELAARIRVTPGFTPDEDWTLTWQGILPGLETRGALFTRSGALRQVSVPLGAGPAQVDLGALHVAVGDRVVITGIEAWCPSGTELEVADVSSGTYATVTVPAGNCLAAVPDLAQEPCVATFRAKDLILAGARTGYVGRPVAGTAFSYTGLRQFYVTDPCTTTECIANWMTAPYALDFPFPLGPSVAFTAAYVDSTGTEVTAEPSRDTAIRFTTKSGVTPTARRPIVDGKVVASPYPAGLALRDLGGSGVGVQVHASYTAGVVVILSSGAAANSMTVVR